MRYLIAALLAFFAHTAVADIIVPLRTIRAREVISAADLVPRAADVPGALSDPARLIGQEARIALYPGRPVRPGDVGPPAIVGRNDLVTLIFSNAGLHIAAEGRALGRGAEGEIIRAMNLSSRTTVTGRIMADGSIEVQQ
ncbi:MAG: flagellar basal body P-ring formation chaperone FlgA [Jhaorihella sp.]